MTVHPPSYRRLIQARLARAAAGFAGTEHLKPSAVLVPIIERNAPTILFTRRTEHLPAHAGQISFPGGRMHEVDTDAAATALRETEEEIGIAPERIEVGGFLDLYTTGTGFAIQPVVGFIQPEFSLRPNPEEVAEVFELPLDFLLERDNYQQLERQWQGAPKPYYALSFGGYTVWGATAAMLVDLCEKLKDA